MIDCLFVCLHGFLGKGEDWKVFKSSVRESLPKKKLEFWCPSLFTGESPLGPTTLFYEWPEKFHKELDKFSFKSCILVGYSMGGRLALSAFLSKPEKFKAAVFLSTNPLLLNAEDSHVRRNSDQLWVKKFINLEWDQLMKEWNQQAVFANESSHPQRFEKDYSRKALSQALQNWSVTEHPFSISDLTDVKTPNLWVAGAKDLKFVAILNHLKAKGVPAEFLILEDCAHRIGLSKNPELIAAISKLC